MAEWESNESSTGCFLCGSSWGTFSNRRHHCRRCGKLVCEACSANRVAPELISKDEKMKASNNPRRVCDSCYLIVMKKEEQKVEVVQKKQRQNELLMRSSIVANSDTLIDVFYLDGSYVTVCFDETSTIADLCKNACAGLPLIALFEVLQDMNDSKQFLLLSRETNVKEKMQQWKTRQLKYVKFVIPMYHPRIDLGPGKTKASALKAISTFTKAPQEGQGDLNTDKMKSIDNSLEPSVQEEIQQLHNALLKSRQQIDTLRSTYNKKGSTQSSYRFYYKAVEDGNPTLIMEKDIPNSFAQVSEEHGKRSFSHHRYSDFSTDDPTQLQNRSGSVNNMTSPSVPQPKRKSGIFSRISSDKKDKSSSKQKMEEERRVDSSQSTSPQSSTPLSAPVSDLVDPEGWYAMDDNDMLVFVRRFYFRMSELELFMKKHDLLFSAVLSLNPDNLTLDPSSACELLYRKEGNMIQNSVSTDSVKEGPHVQLMNASGILHLYHMVTACDGVYEYWADFIESWHSMLRHWLIRLLKALCALPVAYPDKLKAVIYCLEKEGLILEADVTDCIVEAIEKSLTAGISDANIVSSILSPSSTSPTIMGSKKLQQDEGTVMYGSRESMSSSSMMYGSRESMSSKKSSFSFGSLSSRPVSVSSGKQQPGPVRNPNPIQVESKPKEKPFKIVSQLMANIVNTFTSIIGDYLTVIPADINTLTIFGAKVSTIITDEIKTFFKAYKLTMTNADLMEIYKFLEKFTKLTSKFPELNLTHLSLQEFMNEVFKQYNVSTLQYASQTITIVFQTDEALLSRQKSESEMAEMVSVSAAFKTSNSVDEFKSQINATSLEEITRIYTTNWPLEISNMVKYQLVLIPSDSTPLVKVFMSNQLLDVLVEFLEKQRTAINSTNAIGGKPSLNQTERLCLVINNHYSFVGQLNDVIEKWAYDMEDNHMEKISQKLNSVSKAYLENAHSAMQTIVHVIYSEVKDILKVGLFRNGWDDSVKVITTVQNALKRYSSLVHTTLSPLLPDHTYMLQSIDLSMCTSVVSNYLELLLTSGQGGSGSILQMNITTISRLSEDLEMLTKFFDGFTLAEEPMAVSSLSAYSGVTSILSDSASGVGNVLVSTTDNSDTIVGARSASATRPDRIDRVFGLYPNKNKNNNSSRSLSSSSSSGLGEKMRSFINYELKPLRDIVLAIQMNSKFLPDFVKTELYKDFGHVNSVKVWQIIMLWRNESKESISTIHDHMFKNWKPQGSGDTPRFPMVDLNYLQKMKALK